jgi:hypothetical protein
MVAHLWNDSAEQTYHQNFGTIIPSDVQSTHWIIAYKQTAGYQSGTREHDWVLISDHLQDTQALSHFSQWQYIAGLKQHQQWNRSIPSEGANVRFDPGPSIPPSQVQQDDFDQRDNSSPHEQDSQEQRDIATSTQVSHEQLAEQSAPSSEPQPNVSRYGRIRKLQNEMMNPIAFLSHANKDTMYFHEAMQAPDADEFIKAAVKEVNDHIERKHWELIPREQVPEGEKILPAVWSMKRKRDIKTQKVNKYKARLNVHGGKQEYAINYFETYAPVVTWFSIRLLLVLSILNKWYTRQVDFILAYPQADIEFDMYMDRNWIRTVESG